MSCINRSHPEFKRLVALSGENPSLVAINATIWMEDNNTTEFPTIDDLDFSTKKNDKFFSYSPIRKLGIRYNANQYGFMPSNVDWVGVTNEARKLGLTVNKSRAGTWYFKNQRGQFINPHKYQLDSTERRSPEKELNSKLLEWADTHGIKVEAIEEMIERLGPDSRFDGVVGVADLLNKVISIDPTKEKLDTLAEEVSHFATAILKDDVSFKRAMDNIEKTDIYKQVKKDYKDVYVREEDFKKEAVDKLLAQAIIDNFQSNDSTTGVIPYLKALYDKFWKWVNKVLKKSDVQKEIKDSLYPLAKSILNNEHLGELENINNIELPETTFLQKEEETSEPEEPEDSKKDKSEREIAIEFLNDSLLNLKKRLENLKRKKNKEEEINRVQNEIAAVEKSIKEGTLRAGILGVINTAERDIDRIIKVLDSHKKSEKYNTDTYQGIDDFINGYLKLFSDFKDNMAYYEFDAKLREEMNEAMQQLEYKFNRVTVDTDMLILKSAEKIGDDINTDFNGEKIDKNFNPRKILKTVGKDITSWRLLVGNWKQASSPILRAAWSLVEGSNLVVKRKAVEVATELLDAQTAMEKAGFKVNDLVEKTFDKEGNRTVTTQYLIREADWAGYISARNNHRTQMLTKYKYDNWQDFINAYRQKEFTPKEMKVIKAELKNFNTAHPMKAVRDENGNISHYEPSARNPEFKKLMSNVFVKNYYDTLLRVREESLSKLPSRYHNNYYKYMIPGIRAQFVEKLFRKDVSFTNNISQIFQESVFRDQDDTNFGESSELGNKMIPIYFNTMFEDTRELSTDLTRSFTIYAEMAEKL